MTGVPQRVLDALGPGLVSQAGPLFAPLVAAYTATLDAADSLVRPADPAGRSPAFADVDATPYPAWLGQVGGLAIPADTDVEAARALVKGRSVAKRGTPAAIVAAAQSALTGARRVQLLERDGSAYRLRIVTYSGQTPDPDAVMRAVLTEKPAGLLVVHEVALGQDYADTTAETKTYGGHTATGRTYQQRSEVLGG